MNVIIGTIIRGNGIETHLLIALLTVPSKIKDWITILWIVDCHLIVCISYRFCSQLFLKGTLSYNWILIQLWYSNHGHVSPLLSKTNLKFIILASEMASPTPKTLYPNCVIRHSNRITRHYFRVTRNEEFKWCHFNGKLAFILAYPRTRHQICIEGWREMDAEWHGLDARFLDWVTPFLRLLWGLKWSKIEILQLN